MVIIYCGRETALRWCLVRRLSTAGVGTSLQKDQNGNILVNGVQHTWHHHWDGSTMILIPSELHSKVGHVGGKFVVDSGLKGKLPKFGSILNCN